MSEPDLLATAESLKALLLARATGNASATDEEYKLLRNLLRSTPSTKALLPAWIVKCRTLREFWSFIQPKFKTYEERREFVRDEFEPLLTTLEEGSSVNDTSAPRHETAPVAARGAEIDIGILTIREDEFRAVLAAFPDDKELRKLRRHYNIRTADAGGGRTYRVALLRQPEQGNGEAQDAARDMIEELRPTLIIVVGIAGGLPHDDFTLGDVVVSTRINDYSVEAQKEGEAPSYNLSGGPIAMEIAAGVANLPALEEELGDWTSGLPARPTVVLDGEVKGPPEWQDEVRKTLAHHFGNSRTRPPIATAGILASSDKLVKDPMVLFPWIQTARHMLAVEMESAGVYRAARGRAFMLAIRAISDIVGLGRDERWTKYACASAAAFTRAYLRTTPVTPKKTTATRPASRVTASDRPKPSVLASGLPLSEPGREIMRLLAEAYVKAGYPSFKVWMFTPPNQDDPDYGELRALGLVYFGGPRGGPWRLTEEGVRWIMSNRGNLSRGSSVVGSPRETIEEALLRVLHEHADENGEVTATWAEIREWLGSPAADVHAAAIHLKDDGCFRSQTFEGGYDGVCSVVLRR